MVWGASANHTKLSRAAGNLTFARHVILSYHYSNYPIFEYYIYQTILQTCTATTSSGATKLAATCKSLRTLIFLFFLAKMVTVADARRAQRAEGPATIMALGTAPPPKCVEQRTFPAYYFRLTDIAHMTDPIVKVNRMRKYIYPFCFLYSSVWLFMIYFFFS